MDNKNIITHDFPVWRTEADFIVTAHLCESDISDLAKWEQIWAKQVEENTFEICCIPFFTYELALGDRVTTKPLDEKTYVIDKIIEKSGHTTYRVWFHDVGEWDIVIEQIKKLSCLVEIRWNKSKLIGVDAPTSESRKKLEEYLLELEKEGSIKCEIANA